MFVREHMTSQLITIGPETSIIKAQDLMRVNDINRLPVVEHGKLLGIVTKHLINRKLPSDATSLSQHELNYLLGKLTVAEVMDKQVLTLSPDALVEEAAGLMRSNDTGAIVITEGESPVGIITDKDIFKVFVDVSGYNVPGKNIVVDLAEDRVGVLEEVGSILSDLGLSLTHMVIYHHDEGGIRLVMHVATDNASEFAQRLEAKGYETFVRE